MILLRHFRFFKLIFYMLSANSILIPSALSSSHFTSHDGAILGCRRDLHKTVQDLTLWQQYIEQRCHVTKCKLEIANQGLFLKSKFKKEFFNCLWLIIIVVSCGNLITFFYVIMYDFQVHLNRFKIQREFLCIFKCHFCSVAFNLKIVFKILSIDWATLERG